MATSGTVGTTVIDTAKVLEHAFRRIKIHPSKQTPELVALAKESLYLALLNLSNRGLNLWCLQTSLIGLRSGKQTYTLPVGTINLQNVVYSHPTRVEGVNSLTSTTFTTELAEPTGVCCVGVKFSSISSSTAVLLQASHDGVTFFDLRSLAPVGGWTNDEWFWFDLDGSSPVSWYRIAADGPIVVSEFFLASSVSDLPVVQWNLDTWAAISNKKQQGRPVTNYYLEKLLTPQIVLWPVPDSEYDYLRVYAQRQIQDVGSLTQQLEAPQRWLEAIIWQLALSLAFEVPEVDPNLAVLVSKMADKTLLDAEREETDGAPIMLQPNIGVYTR